MHAKTRQLPPPKYPYCLNNYYSALVNTDEYNSELNNADPHYTRNIARLQVVHGTTQRIEVRREASRDLRQPVQSQARRRVAPLATFTTAPTTLEIIKPEIAYLCFPNGDSIYYCYRNEQPKTPERKPSLLSTTIPHTTRSLPIGRLRQPATASGMASSSQGKCPAPLAKTTLQVQNFFRDRISETIPKFEPKLVGQSNYTEWINKLEMTLFLYELNYVNESY